MKTFFAFLIIVDNNECELGTHNCHLDANCANNKGSFRCTCKIGYTGNGVNCSGEMFLS